jgi:hypothetical protein
MRRTHGAYILLLDPQQKTFVSTTSRADATLYRESNLLFIPPRGNTHLVGMAELAKKPINRVESNNWRKFIVNLDCTNIAGQYRTYSIDTITDTRSHNIKIDVIFRDFEFTGTD